MVKQIFFNNKFSNEEFNLLISEPPTISISNENIEVISVPGRNGSLTKRLGTYNDKIITVKFKLVESDLYAYEYSLINITEWLNIIKNNKLYLDVYNFEDYYYKVKYCEIGDIQRQLNWYGEFEVKFICEPFKYSSAKNINIKENKNIYCSSTIDTEPVITVDGVGDITLIIGNNSIILKDITDTITIDSEMLMCYKNVDGIYTNMNKHMNGDYPKLKKGSNQISFIGNVTNINIKYENKFL